MRGDGLSRSCLSGILAALLLLGGLHAAIAEKRVALVIGNSANQSTAALANPENDAGDMTGLSQRSETTAISEFFQFAEACRPPQIMGSAL